MLRFRLFGFPVTVEPWHWLILAFLGGALQIRDRDTLALVLMFMAAGFVSILIHELGHALTSRRFGCRHVEIVMHGMGGVAISHNAHFTRGQNIMVSLAGPMFQIAAGVIGFLVIRKAPLPDAPVTYLLFAFAGISIFWALINLLPVYPLDGGQILWHTLGPRNRSLALRISMVTAIAGAVATALLFRSLLFPILLGFMAWQNYQMLSHSPGPRSWR